MMLGGYAKEMSQGYKEAQKRMIQKQAREVPKLNRFIS